jgi:hypothetical protein
MHSNAALHGWILLMSLAAAYVPVRAGNLERILSPPRAFLSCGVEAVNKNTVIGPGPPRTITTITPKQCRSVAFLNPGVQPDNPAAELAVRLSYVGAFAATVDPWRWASHACRQKVGAQIQEQRDSEATISFLDSPERDCWNDATKRAAEAGADDPTFGAIATIQGTLDGMDLTSPANQLVLARLALLTEIRPTMGRLSVAEGLLSRSNPLSAREYECFTATMNLLLVPPLQWPSSAVPCPQEAMSMISPQAPFTTSIKTVRRTRVADAWMVEVTGIKFRVPVMPPPPRFGIDPAVAVGICDADEQGNPSLLESPLVQSPNPSVFADYQMPGHPSSPSYFSQPATRGSDGWLVDHIQAVVPQPRYEHTTKTWICLVVQTNSTPRVNSFLAHEAAASQRGCNRCGNPVPVGTP